MKLISQLSRDSGIPVHTIRYYERYGLFKGKKKPNVKSNNYTYYDSDVDEKLELIKEAKIVGFTLSEIRKLIDAWHSKRLTVEKKKEVLLNKIKEIESKIDQLNHVKKILLDSIENFEDKGC